MTVQLSDREQWAETEAEQCDKIAEELEGHIVGWLARGNHPSSLHEATVCAIKAETWRQVARSLRQPRLIREEMKARGDAA